MRAFLIALLLCGAAQAFKTPTPKSDPADDLEEIAVEASGAAHLDQLPEGTAVDLSRAAAFLVGEDWATSFFGEGDVVVFAKRIQHAGADAARCCCSHQDH